MPKAKTHRGAAKRLWVSGSGKVRAKRAGRNHLLAKKSQKRKRRLRVAGVLPPAQADRAKRMLPGR